MNSNESEQPFTENGAPEPLMGLAKLMKMAFSGVDLAPLGAKLIQRVERNPNDANALMDLSTVLQLKFNPEISLATQAQALEIRQLYHLPANGQASIRLLAIMSPGELMSNAPLEFLLEDADVSLDMLYVAPNLPFPPSLPDHDLVFIGVSESDRNHQLLAQLEHVMVSWPRPVLNVPSRIAQIARDSACALLKHAPGIMMPVSVRIDRQTLERIGNDTLSMATILDDGDFPVIVRPIGSHAGRGLAKIDNRAAMTDYLQTMPESTFYVTNFVDYRGSDGLFRKYRIVIIGGRPFAGHMGISEHWMIHYLNAGMTESAAKRAEEERFMADFEHDFARRHENAFNAITERMKLDYLVVDCAETVDGRLLIFEVDPGAVIHAMDSADIFPYKQAQMQKVFDGFREMLINTINRSGS